MLCQVISVKVWLYQIMSV